MGKAGRFDLLVDASMHLETEQADKVGQQFFEIAEAIRPIPEKLGGRKWTSGLAGSMASLTNNRDLYRLHEPTRPVETGMVSWGFVRARACETTARKLFRWLFVTRDSLRGTNDKHNEWEDCYIFHNGDLVLDDINWSLVVCDGDIEFVNQAAAEASVLIARGSIHSKNGLRFCGSSLYSQGNIVAPSGHHNPNDVLLAGGKVEIPKLSNKKGNELITKSGVKENPFPVRFFETADVGVETTFKADTLTVTKLTPGSPLAKYGVKEGDVVTQLNDKVVKTANDFRRELRDAVTLEAGIFHITRGTEKLTRVVYFKNGLEK